MSPEKLLEELRLRGIEITAAGENLKYHAPKGAITPELKAAIAENKPSLIRLLSDRSCTEPTDPLSSLAAGCEWRIKRLAKMLEWLEENCEQDLFSDRFEIYGAEHARVARVDRIIQALQKDGFMAIPDSLFGGDTVIFLRDEGIEVPEHLGGCVSYTLAELESLVGSEREALLLVHDAKKHLGGRVIADGTCKADAGALEKE